MRSSLTYVIKVKKKHHEEPNWHRNENPFDRQNPEINEPVSINSGIEGSCMWQSLDV